jgi:hypothetical protein
MASDRSPYCPPTLADWQECYQITCAHCANHLDCAVVEAMIEHTKGGPWPDGGWVTDPGASMSCLSYRPAGSQPQITRQQLRRLARMNPRTLAPVCGGCAAKKGSEASQSLHTRRDFEAAVRERRVFLCHERNGYCGGWVRAMLAKAGRKVDG